MADLKKTVQVFELTIPSGTAAGTAITDTETFRSDFKRCTGYALHVVSGTENVSVSIVMDDGDVVQDFVHQEHIEVNAATPVDKRYHPADFASASQKVRISGRPIANLVADVVLQFVFQLEKE